MTGPRDRHAPLPGRKAVLRDAWIALSLANLSYLRVWSELLTYTRSDEYLMKLPPAPGAYVAVILNVLLMAAILFAGVRLARRFVPRSSFRWVEVAFLLFLVIPLNAARSVLSNRWDFLRSSLFGIVGTRGVVLIAAALAIIGLVVIWRFRTWAAHAAAAILLALVPFCAITFGQAVWKASHYNPAGFASKPASPLLPVAAAPRRVVWVIADEWDYRLTFPDRPASLSLPEIDRLRTESFFATRADPPGPETPISLPAYFTGRLVDRVSYDGPSELQIRFRGTSSFEPWSAQNSVFARARSLGFNTALVEWFHPTCRVLGGLTDCAWWEMARQFNSMGHSFPQVLVNQTRSLFETSLTSVFGQSLSGRQHGETYHEILRRGIEVANNPLFSLSVIHLPIPHAPHVYDRRTGTFTLKNSPIRGYIDSLALLDRAVGELRRSMEASGEWDRTTVLFTSDHHYRQSSSLDGKDDPRIPYLLKPASSAAGLEYQREFNAVVTGDLLLAILRGEVSTPADVARWLDGWRPQAPES